MSRVSRNGFVVNRKWILLSAASLLLTIHPLPLAAASDNAGTKNGNFLKLATDARGVALGDTSVISAEGVDALRWNPAGLATLESKEAAGTHVEYYQGVRVENVGMAYPFGLENGALAASAFYMSAGKLDGRDNFGNPTGDFDFYNLVGSVGYGRQVLTRGEGLDLSAGVVLKMVQEKIAEKSYNNPALDIGLQSRPIDHLRIGLTARNLASSKADFAREIVLGAGYQLFGAFTPAVAMNYSNDAPIRYTVSGEYRIPELEGAAIRAGYKTHDELDDSIDSQIKFLRKGGIAGLTMGAGFEYRPPVLPNLKLGLDYGMAPFGALGISHTITVKARW